MRADEEAPHQRPGCNGTIEMLELGVALGPSAARLARDAVTAWAAGHVARHVVADLQLLVSELVTNSLRHAQLAPGQKVRVGARLADGWIRLEVENAGMAGSIAVRAPDTAGGGGFGLQLVDALTARWGVVRDGRTCVWAEIDSTTRSP